MNNYDVTLEAPEAGLEAFTLEFAQDRIEEMPKVLESLQSGDHTLLHEFTHKWIGFSKPYGFNWLADAARQLKEDAKEGKVSDAQQTLVMIENYLEDKLNYIKNNS